jgi:hypothetical protein
VDIRRLEALTSSVFVPLRIQMQTKLKLVKVLPDGQLKPAVAIVVDRKATNEDDNIVLTTSATVVIAPFEAPIQVEVTCEGDSWEGRIEPGSAGIRPLPVNDSQIPDVTVTIDGVAQVLSLSLKDPLPEGTTIFPR